MLDLCFPPLPGLIGFSLGVADLFSAVAFRVFVLPLSPVSDGFSVHDAHANPVQSASEGLCDSGI